MGNGTAGVLLLSLAATTRLYSAVLSAGFALFAWKKYGRSHPIVIAGPVWFGLMIISLAPSWLHSYFINAGQAAYSREDYSAAIRSFGRALMLKDDGYGHVKLAESYFAAQKYDNAVDECRKLAQYKPEDPTLSDDVRDGLSQLHSSFMSIAQTAYNQGDYATAITSFNKALTCKEDADGHLGLADAYHAENKYGKEAYELRLALPYDSNDPGLHYRLGITLERLGRRDEAIQEYRQSLAADPGFKDGHQRLADALLADRKFDEAQEENQKLLEITPYDAHPHASLAYIWEKKCKYAAAEGELIQAEELYARDHSYTDRFMALMQNNLAYVLAEEKKYFDAMLTINSVLRTMPEDAMAQGTLGFILAGQGRIDDAIIQYRRALQQAQSIDLQDAPGIALVYLHLAQALQMQSKMDEATQEYEKAKSLDAHAGTCY